MLNMLTLSAENVIEIGLVVSEIWPGKSKVRGAFIQTGTFIRQNTVCCIRRFILTSDLWRSVFAEWGVWRFQCKYLS